MHCCLLMHGPGLRELACPRSERLTLQFPLVVSMHAPLSQLNLTNGLCAHGPWRNACIAKATPSVEHGGDPCTEVLSVPLFCCCSLPSKISDSLNPPELPVCCGSTEAEASCVALSCRT